MQRAIVGAIETSPTLALVVERAATDDSMYTPCDCEPRCVPSDAFEPRLLVAGSSTVYEASERLLVAKWSGRVVLVGEQNPYGGPPRNALLDDPPGSAGERLRRLVLGVSEEDYHGCFARHNLCPGKWSAPVARRRAELLAALYPSEVLVLLGKKVRDAFGMGSESDFSVVLGASSPRRRQIVVCLPHPSGLCRAWHEPNAFERARSALRAACPDIVLGGDR